MKIIKSERKLCLCCMEEHNVQRVEVQEENTFKGQKVSYTAVYEYCDLADEYLTSEEMVLANDIAMKNAFREQNHLLTTEEIVKIRGQYSISQKDLACLLGWGEKTITRYEGHQVQDMAHDFVLRKIADDPEWFLELLENGKTRLSQAAYEKYYVVITKEYELTQDRYLRKSIQAQYVKYQEQLNNCGNTILNIDKIVDVICYYADSPKVDNLYKVKLMKLLWYADFLSYKRYGHAITGLVYRAMPMGAVPVAHKLIIDLKGISYEEIEFENGTGYKFVPSLENQYRSLLTEDREVLDSVIEIFGKATKEQIVNKMHRELAYKETKAGEIIGYQYAKELMIE